MLIVVLQSGDYLDPHVQGFQKMSDIVNSAHCFFTGRYEPIKTVF